MAPEGEGEASMGRRVLTVGAAVLLAILAALGIVAAAANASGSPMVGATWSSAVASDSAKLSAEIDPNGFADATYHFDYTTEAAYQADKAIPGHDGFTGALRVPPTDAPASLGGPPSYTKAVFNLTSATTYRYRVVATNGGGSATGSSPPHTFTTLGFGGGSLLPDSRGWEMVSPVQKNGGQVDPPEAIAGGGVMQAAADGGSVTYGSSASFAAGQGAPPASQYIATRDSGGWATQNITAPIFSATYDSVDQGVPYQLFSGDLAKALLLNGEHCRGGVQSGCAVANPPLAGTDAPAGYQDYYLRDNGAGSFDSLLTSAGIAGLGLDPATFDLRLLGASPDLAEVLLQSCSRLTAGAADVCAGSDQNLYRWSRGTGTIAFVDSGPPAELAVRARAIADPSGLDYYTQAGDLYRYSAATDTATRLTSSADVEGALGAAADGSHLYFLRASGLYLCLGSDGAATNGCDGASKVADAADASNYPPATGTARVSADGTKALFVSSAQLTTSDGATYDNTDLLTGNPDPEVYLYDTAGPTLTCVSCNPTNERPIGPSMIPGAIPNGSAPGSTDAYKPRVLSTDGKRVFFDSLDALALTDTNSEASTGAGIPDAYQWEAQGEGSCATPGGCVALISSGRSKGGALFVDASADGADAFFLTDDSLAGADPGAVDLYDARIGGGFPDPSSPIPCEGDACQALPPEPVDPTLTTLLSGHGNPPVHYYRLNCRPGFHKRKGKCVRKPKRAHHKKHHGKKKHHKRWHHKKRGQR